jgi:hypothetical protein
MILKGAKVKISAPVGDRIVTASSRVVPRQCGGLGPDGRFLGLEVRQDVKKYLEKVLG